MLNLIGCYTYQGLFGGECYLIVFIHMWASSVCHIHCSTGSGGRPAVDRVHTETFLHLKVIGLLRRGGVLYKEVSFLFCFLSQEEINGQDVLTTVQHSMLLGSRNN